MFRIGDLFEKLNAPYIGPGRKQDNVSKEKTDEFSLPLINCKWGDNGIMYYGRPSDFVHYENVLSVIYNGPPTVGTVYAQPLIGVFTDAYLIALKKSILPQMSMELCLYLKTAVEKAIHDTKYSRAHKATWTGKVENDEIFLPVTAEGTPDWKYMQERISVLEQERISVLEQERISVLEQYLLVAGLDDYELTTKDYEVLDKKTAFKPFRIGDLFVPLKGGYIGAGKKIGSAMKTRSNEYCIPLTCAKLGDNGIMYWGKKGDFRTYTNAISIIADGAVSAGLVYAQPEEAGVYSHSYFIRLENVEVSYRTNLYLASVLNKVLYPKYSRERPPRWDNKVENDSILLPVTAEGQPDYTYMEQYIRAQEKLAIRDAVQFKDRIIEETKSIVEV